MEKGCTLAGLHKQTNKQTNKPIILIPWAVKSVAVGKAPTFLTVHNTVGFMFTVLINIKKGYIKLVLRKTRQLSS